MNLYIESLFNKYCSSIKSCISFELAKNQSPYYENSDEDLKYKEEYVNLCVNEAISIFKSYNFSNDLTVLYEDKYNCHEKGERDFIASTLEPLSYRNHPFKWYDEDETYEGVRYIWHTNKIKIKELFRKIILSEIGENSELASAVYLIDNKSENVFFLYDDRGIDIYLNKN